MKKLLAFILSLAMLLSLSACGNNDNSTPDTPKNDQTENVDNSSQPEEEKLLAKILTFSDYQKWTSSWTDDWDTLQSQLESISDGAKKAGADPDYMLFGGDFSCLSSHESSEDGMSQVLSIIRNKWNGLNDENTILIQGNHDPENTEGLAQTGPYEFDDFIIYVINEDDFPSKQGESIVLKNYVQPTTDAISAWLESKIQDKETRPILIASHTGLHYDVDRQDGNNQYAYVLFDAINEAAKQLDIIFLFGHNHTNGDERVGGSITMLQKGDSLDVCTETSIANRKGTPCTLNFTYMNYGYVGYIGDINNSKLPDTEPVNVLTISEIWIYNTKIEVYRYSANGLEQDFNAEISRDHRTGSNDIKTYTITLDPNGGTMENGKVTKGEGVSTIPLNKPRNGAATFTGWNTSADGSGQSYEPGQTVVLDGDLTLYAQWINLIFRTETVSGSFTGTFEDNDYDSYINSLTNASSGITKDGTWGGSFPDITGLIQSVAKLSYVTQLEITVTASDTTPCAKGTSPRCELYWDSRAGTRVETKSFSDGTLKFSTSVPDDISAVVLNPYAFASESGEIDFEVTATITYGYVGDGTESMDGTEFTLCDELKDGESYILIWNSAISGNSGTNYAMCSDADTKIIDRQSFIGSQTLIIDESNYKNCIWKCKESDGLFIFENSADGKYLSSKDMNLSTVASSDENCLWSFRDYQGYAQLAPSADDSRFIRYSVSAAKLRLGTKSISTDVNNSNVFIYRLGN